MGMGFVSPHKPPTKEDRCTNGKHEQYGSMSVLTLMYILANIGYQLIGVPYTGLMADKTPSHQRGISSGLQGLMVIVGCVPSPSSQPSPLISLT